MSARPVTFDRTGPRPPDPPRLPDGFDVPFDEAIAWAGQRKAILPGEFYGARLQAVRARSFAIAGLSALDQVQQVADSLAAATASGQTLREWQRNLPDSVFSLGKARRELIFRNAVQTHYGIGRTIQQRQNAEARPFLMWDAINDSRTRPTHRAMDGFIAPIDDAIWKKWTPPAGHQCLLPGTRVQGDFRIGLKSRYAGPAVEILAGSGARLSVTGNHPVLTRRGWVAAQELQAGDDILGYGGVVDAAALAVEHDENSPPTAEEVFTALASQALGVAQRSAFKLHGDVQFGEGEVHVAGVDGELVNGFKPVFAQRQQKRKFVPAHVGTANGELHAARSPFPGAVGAAILGDQPLDVAARRAEGVGDHSGAEVRFAVQRYGRFLKHVVTRIRGAPRGGALALDCGAALLHQRPLGQFGLAASANQRPVAKEKIAHRGPRDAGFQGNGFLARACRVLGDKLLHVGWDALWPRLRASASNSEAVLVRASLNSSVSQQTVEKAVADGGLFQALAHGFPGEIRADQVVGLRYFTFRGHVYDFETKQGWQVAAGLIVSNCRCTRIALSEAQARARGYPKLPPNVEPDAGWEGDPTDDDVPGRLLAERISRASPAIADTIRARSQGAPVADDPQRGAPDCDLLDGSRFAAEWCIGPRPGLPTWKDADRPDLRRVGEELRLPAPAMLVAAATRSEAVGVLAQALGLSDEVPLLGVVTPVENAILRLDRLAHLVEKETDARERYANFILPTLRDPFEVWGVEYADGIRNRYIGLFKGARDFMVVLRVNLDGSLMWNVMQASPKDMNKHRVGNLRWGK